MTAPGTFCSRLNQRTLALLLLLTLGAAAMPAQQERFSAGVPVAHAVEIPEAALTVLREDSQVVTALDYVRLPAEDLPQAWFAAAKVALAEGGEQNLLVIGQDLLESERVAPFWILRPKASGYELVLRTAARTLEIGQENSNGVRELRVSVPSGRETRTRVYRFDGAGYALAREE